MTRQENVGTLEAPFEEPPLRWCPFPTHLLPEEMKALVVEGAKSIGTDETFVALPMLAVIANAIGATRTVQLKRGWQEPAVFWCVVVSPSGATKSQGRKYVLAPLLKRQQQAERVYRQLEKEFGAEEAKYQRDLAAWKKRKGDDPLPVAPEKPRMKELFTSDATIEAMVRLLVANPRGVLFEVDELAAWVKGFDAYKGGKGADAQQWLNLFGAGTIKVNRAGLEAPLFISRAAVSVSGTIQPSVLTGVLSGENMENGLAARLLIAEPPRQQKRWTDSEVSEEVEEAFAERLNKLYELQFATNPEGDPYPIALPLAADAKERFKAFVNEHGAEGMQRDGAEAAAWSKLEGYAARIALVLQLFENPQAMEVSDQWVAAGIALARWFGNEAMRFYRGATESEVDQSRKRAAWIETKGGSVTVREFQRGQHNLETADEARAALDSLVAMELGEWVEVPSGQNGGRPTRRFRLHDGSTSTEPPESRDSEGCVSVDGQGLTGKSEAATQHEDEWEEA